MMWAIVMGIIALLGTVSLIKVTAATQSGIATVPVRSLKASAGRRNEGGQA